MSRDDFCEVVYAELQDDPDNYRANRIIDAHDTSTASILAELKQCRNELCLYCGKYHAAHLGACDGCRWAGRRDPGDD